VGDVERGDARAVVKGPQFGLHCAPEVRIQIGQWLIHQDRFGRAGKAARQGNALALAAGKRLWTALGKVGKRDCLEMVRRAAQRFGPRHVLGFIGKGDVFGDRHVRP